MHFAAQGHEVRIVDNYLRRAIAQETDSGALIEGDRLPARTALFERHFGRKIDFDELDLMDSAAVFDLFEKFSPDVVVHYAEQPSAPYSMKDFDSAHLTLTNNLGVTFNIIWAVKEKCPECHIVKLGTMGEYGTPDIDIEEGWIDIRHKGREHRFLFPRQAGSLYHTTKVLDTDLLWFYVRTYGLRVTDLMQGPVYGLDTAESLADEGLLPNFHYDDIFGTVVNRFLVQAVAGVPLTVYGKGGQTRGYLNLKDTLQCVDLAAAHPAGPGELRIFNQVTQTFTVNELAEIIERVGKGMGLSVTIKRIDNPRKEAEDHYYNPVYTGLKELGLKPHLMTDDVVGAMLEKVIRFRERIVPDRIMPRVRWSS